IVDGVDLEIALGVLGGVNRQFVGHQGGNHLAGDTVLGQSGFSNLRPVGLDILGAIVEGDGAGGLHGVLRLGALYGGSEGDVVELIDVGLFGGFDLIGGHDG